VSVTLSLGVCAAAARHCQSPPFISTASPILPPPLPITGTTIQLEGGRYERDHHWDQRIISSMAKPGALIDKYRDCEPPPNLNLFNPFRDDDRIALNLYTDPDYFLRLWVKDMKAQTQNQRRRRKVRAVAALTDALRRTSHTLGSFTIISRHPRPIRSHPSTSPRLSTPAAEGQATIIAVQDGAQDRGVSVEKGVQCHGRRVC
jgi:hypothetical protein